MDLFWRENLVCPTEPEYIDMVNNSVSSATRLGGKDGSSSNLQKRAAFSE